MPYIINRFDGSQLLSVEDGTVDNTTDLKFVGKNYSGYGEIQNENMLFLLENFAGSTQPTKAITGQLWFDSANNKLKFYVGNNQWKNTGGAEVSQTQPTGLAEGDFWFNSSTNQLFAKTSTDDFVLVGPQAAGTGDTQMRSLNVFDTTNVARPVILSLVDDTVQFIISNEEFTLRAAQDSTTPSLTDFDVVKKGMTLARTKSATNGVTTNAGQTGEPILWGTSSNALKLGGVDASSFIQSGNTSFNPDTTPVSFNDIGLTVGTGADLLLNVINSNVGQIINTVGDTINIGASTSPGNDDPIVLVKNETSGDKGLIPGANDTYTIGRSTQVWNNVFATTFTGTATQADTLKVGSSYRTATITPDENTIAARDPEGNLSAETFDGTASKARYADLAEKYTTGDEELPAGTAVAVGADDCCEVVPAKSSDLCIGVVSTDPAYMMNSEADGQYIALKGRVPVRVKGAIKKGQAVYAWEDGVCGTVQTNALVGVALEGSNDENEKLIEVVLKV
jgi:hypothetical protein